ncbi:hypothetical protein BS78_10G217600 [Paspalum vaginatum]|nr:hypothetical protein BS78_10G217600 [Paspalum vaginatum]
MESYRQPNLICSKQQSGLGIQAAVFVVVHALEKISLVLVVTDDCQQPYVKRDRERNAAKDDLPGMCMRVSREHTRPVESMLWCLPASCPWLHLVLFLSRETVAGFNLHGLPLASRLCTHATCYA